MRRRRPFRISSVRAAVSAKATTTPNGDPVTRTLLLPAVRVTLGGAEVTESLLAAVPLGSLRVPVAEFGAVWAEAERLNQVQAGRQNLDWYPAGVAVSCRWLAGAVVEDAPGRREPAPEPATRRKVRAHEEQVEAKYVVAEQFDVRQPDLLVHQPGGCEGIRAALR